MAEKMTLHQKILKIADMAGALQKTAEGYGYKYVPEEEIQAKVTAGLQKYGVMLYMSMVPDTLNVQPYEYEKYDKSMKGYKKVCEVIVSAEMQYRWVDVDSGEAVETNWGFVGQMEDASQAMGSGLTYSNRYYLMKQLQLATTESDPDNYRSKQREAENYHEVAAAKELKEAIQGVVKAGSALIKHGMNKDEMYKIVAKYNDGNTTPSSINSVEACTLILAEFKEIEEKIKNNIKENANV